MFALKAVLPTIESLIGTGILVVILSVVAYLLSTVITKEPWSKVFYAICIVIAVIIILTIFTDYRG